MLSTRPPFSSSPAYNWQSFLVSVAIHGAIVGVLVWLSVGNNAQPLDDLSSTGNATRGVVDGPGILTRTPALGPSLSPAQAAPYLGSYTIVSPGRTDAELRVTLEQNGEGHWSLRIIEDHMAANALVPVAADSFVYRLNREHRVAFVRRDGIVTAIELSWMGSVRRGVKVSVATRK